MSSGENYEGCNRIITAPGYIGSGGNSGFQAINLAVQLGAKRIVLVGYDMRLDGGIHWHGEHEKALNNPNLGHIIKWRKIIDEAAGDLAALGIEVVNVGACSALTAYPFMDLQDALDVCDHGRITAGRSG